MKKESLLMDMEAESPESTSESFTLESILAEFGSSGKKTGRQPTENKAQAAALEPTDGQTPEMPAKPTAERKKEPETRAADATKAAADDENKNAAQQVPTEPSHKQKEPSVSNAEPKPVSRAKRKAVRPEDLEVPSAVPTESVIDTAAFDSVYEKKQRRIQKLRKQILSENASAQKATERARKQQLKPAHIKTGPIPVPAAAKAEMKREQAERPIGQRYPRPKPMAKPRAEKPKPTLNPLQMLRKFERSRRSASTRFWLVLFLCIPLFYMAAASYLDLPLPAAADFASNPRTYAIIHAVLLGCVIALSGDMIVRGLLGLFLLRAGSDTLVAASLCVSEAYCIANILFPDLCRNASGAAVYAPVAVLPALAALFSLLSSKIRYQAYYRSIRSCYRLQHAKTLTVLPEKYDGDVIYTVAKATSYQGFYRTFQENDLATSVMYWYTPVVLLASLFLAVYCSYSTHTGAPFLWSWSIIVALTPALGIPLAAVLPLAKASKRLYKSGILVGGGKSVTRMSSRSFVLMTDDDVFPGDAISINGYKLMNPDKKELALSAAASLLDAAQTALAAPFVRLASENYAPIRPVKDLLFSDTGGITGTIDGQRVMVGTASFVQRAWIKIPPDIKLKTAVFCVVDSELLEVFAVRYQVTPKADYALNLLEDNGYMPIIAARDFNVTASFIQSRFGISSSDVVYPAANLRVTLSDPSLELESNGLVVTYGGGDAVAEALVSCRRCKTSTRLSLIFSMISSVIGLLLGVLMAYFGWTEAATPVNLLTYYLLWMIPTLVFAAWVNRF